ncbi:MAG: methionyl-tRNA formyltransferase [Magnetovibrio sp.]|nr:methionyl-tRNA formyltransferase [Magnetovibrio sp.]
MVASNMLAEIILLTGEVEAPHLSSMLHSHNSMINIVHVDTADQLSAACEIALPHGKNRRLIAFCTRAIVPERILNNLNGPAYNFHPGPPTYPGSHPASFAIYEKARKYGVTVHEMTAQVDTGPIVAVKWFEISPKMRFADLELHAYKFLVATFSKMAKRLATNALPLPYSGDKWSGNTSTNEEFESMRKITEDMDEEEIKRRFRAFG